MADFTDRFREALDESGLSQAQMARDIGLNRAAIQKWYNGYTKNPKLEFVSRAAARIGVCSDWLMAGRGPKYPESSNANTAPVETAPFRIPKISFVQAGAWSEATDPYAKGDGDGYIYTHKPGSSNRFALTIRGDSMSPDFREGDVIIVDPEIQPRPGDFVVAKNGNQEATFKKYRPRGLNEHGDEYFELVPVNEDYPTLRSDLTPIEIVGTAVDLHKSLR